MDLEVRAELMPLRATMNFWGDPEDLAKTIDGIDASGRGWSVVRRSDRPQATIFRTAAPLKEDFLLLTLCFQSGRPYGSMAEFSLSFTSDDQPSLKGTWRPLTIVNQFATTGSLTLMPNGRLRAEEVVAVTTGRIPDNNYQVTVRTAGRVVTGFQIDVYPVRRSLPQLLPEVVELRDTPVMAWAMYGDFVLTEFRATRITHSTNIALGAPVTASHPLYQTTMPVGQMTAAALTDGLPSTFAHPQQPDLGDSFHFEIDLGSEHALNHLSLWGRNDGLAKENRMSRVKVRLYDQNPAEGALPVWVGIDREDGSYPLRGEVDILRASAGQGRFGGRYIRLSSDSPVPLSPQIAEVEVYPVRRLIPVSLRADEHWSSLVLRQGDYTLEAQASHSDGTWDATLMSLPLEVLAPFTQSRSFMLLVALCTLAVGGLLAWFVSHRRIVALEALSALAAERTRIARDTLESLARFLGQHCTKYLGPVGIACRVDAPPVWPVLAVPAQVRHELVMVVKEALQNVVKHSGAREVEITLAVDESYFTIRIADDGCGFLETSTTNGRSGLANMNVRLKGLGGTCEVKRLPKGGTAVILRAPFQSI